MTSVWDFFVCFFCLFVFWTQHITNPRKAKGQQDLVVNNPLSQDEGVSVCGVSCLLFVSQMFHILHVKCDHDTFLPNCVVAIIIEYFSDSLLVIH